MSSPAEHKKLGMDTQIPRRDFVSGVAMSLCGMSMNLLPAAAALAAPGTETPGDASTDKYANPPRLTGLRGQYPGSFETAHRARDGAFRQGVVIDVDSEEEYDLVIVGGGISGLSAAYFYQRALGARSRILIIDNHDDFGGHAKRNEFHHNGRMYLVNGGTQSVDCPYPYSFTAKSLLKDLGITVDGFFDRYADERLFAGLTRGVFFDNEHFLADKLVAGASSKPWPQFFAEAPLTPSTREGLTRLWTAQDDYMPSLSPGEKAEALKKISYGQFLHEYVKLNDSAVGYFAGEAFRNNKRIDTCPAYEAWREGLPGYSGMTITGEPVFADDYKAHFPDGNATITRLLVSRLVPDALSDTHDMTSVVTAQCKYSELDRPGAAVRIRLNSTAVHVQHDGNTAKARRVNVCYVNDGKTYRVRGDNVILACFNNIIPYIVPDLPEEQKQALAYASKVPMQYSNVLLRNWLPWKNLGVSSIYAPYGYHTSMYLDYPISIGEYKYNSSPDEPIVLRMVRNPNSPGLPRKEQHRLGRLDMLNTSFETGELEIRRQLARVLGPGGFDPATDILAVTINRWPHGYAYTYDTLSDGSFRQDERPHVIGRRAFGRIAIANADAGAAAFTNEAIDQAERAVHDCLYSKNLV